jgi:hypothetical protein
MAKRDLYDMLGSPAARRRTSSRKPIASSPCNTTRTAIRTTPTAEAKFKEVERGL